MSLKTDILNILGHNSTSSYLSDDIDEYTIIEQAIWEAANALPKKMLLTANGYLGYNMEDIDDDDGGNFDVNLIMQSGSNISANDLILFVERIKSNNVESPGEDVVVESYSRRQAKEVSQTEKEKVLDSDSIYYATDYSPVYWLERKSGATTSDERTIYSAPISTPVLYENGTKNWLKNGTAALKIWVYSRQTSISDSTDSYTGIPTQAKSFVDRMCALKLLEIKLAEQSTNEEDGELFQLLSAQRQVFQEDLKNELGMFREMYK